MPAVDGNYAGDITEIWYSATPIDHTEAAIETLIGTPANRVGSVTELGELSAEATNIEFGIAGEEYSSSLPGQRSPGTYDFTLAVNWNDTLHNTLAADNGRVSHTFVLVFNQSATNATYVAFDGRIGNATIGGGVGEVGTLQMSVYRTGGHTIVNNS